MFMRRFANTNPFLQSQMQTPSMARPIGEPLPTTAPAQPQTIGQGQRNFDRLNVQQALDLSTGNTKMTPAFMEQYDVTDDGTVNITDVMTIMDQKKARAKQNLAPFGSQAFNPQVQAQTQSMARPIAQPMPATMASPSMAATQNPFARSMEDGGVVYMENGGNPLKKIYDSVVSGAKKVGEFLSSGQSPSQMEFTSDPDKVSAYTEALAKTGLKDNVTGYGNILSLSDLKTTAMGGDPGDAELRAAFNDLTFADRQALQGFTDTANMAGSDDEEARSKAFAAYKNAIKSGAGEGVSQDYIRGRTDARAESFVGGSAYDATKAAADAGADIDMSVYDQALTSKTVNGVKLVGYQNEKGEFQPISFNDANRALAAGIVDMQDTQPDPTPPDPTPPITPTTPTTSVVQPTVVPTPSVTPQVAPIQPVPTTPANPFQRPEDVPSPYANPFEASPSLFDVQQLATSPFSSRFGDQNLTIYDSLAPFTGGQQPQPQTFEEIMAQFDPFNPLKNQV